MERGRRHAIGLPGFYPSVEPRERQAGLSALGPADCRMQSGTLADNEEAIRHRSSLAALFRNACATRQRD